MLGGSVATQVNQIQLNFNLSAPSWISVTDVTGPRQQTDVLMELIAFGMSFEKAVEKPVKEVEQKIPFFSHTMFLSVVEFFFNVVWNFTSALLLPQGSH